MKHTSLNSNTLASYFNTIMDADIKTMCTHLQTTELYNTGYALFRHLLSFYRSFKNTHHVKEFTCIFSFMSSSCGKFIIYKIMANINMMEQSSSVPLTCGIMFLCHYYVLIIYHTKICMHSAPTVTIF
jgi:hypothetical protein